MKQANNTPTELLKVENTSTEEQETTIILERVSDRMSIYTSDNTMITKLNRLIKANPEEYIIEHTDNTGSFVNAPASLLTLRAKTRVSTLTEEQRQAQAERIRATLHS